MASHGIHGIELAAGVGGTQHRLVVGAGSNRMREAGNGRIARARSVNGGDIGGLKVNSEDKSTRIAYLVFFIFFLFSWLSTVSLWIIQ